MKTSRGLVLGSLAIVRAVDVAVTGFRGFFIRDMSIPDGITTALKSLGIFVLFALLVSGCSDTNYALQRALISADCRPEKLTPSGQCTPLK